MTITPNRIQDIDTEKPTSDLWSPHWLVEVGNEVMVGITMDDGCYVALTQTSGGQWKPMTHIPVEAAKMIGSLVNK